MAPSEEDRLSLDELDVVLREWKSPAAPARLRAAVFPQQRPWWMRPWSVSVRVPLPVACALALAIGAVFWRLSGRAPVPPAPPPQAVVRTERVEVPVVRDQESTKYVYVQSQTVALTFNELRPVSDLRPKIHRSGDAKN
jgi:hypothetical protein